MPCFSRVCTQDSRRTQDLSYRADKTRRVKTLAPGDFELLGQGQFWFPAQSQCHIYTASGTQHTHSKAPNCSLTPSEHWSLSPQGQEVNTLRSQCSCF